MADRAYGLPRDNRAAPGDYGNLSVTLQNPDSSRLAGAFEVSDEPVTSPGQLRDTLSKPCGGPRLLLARLPFSDVWRAHRFAAHADGRLPQFRARRCNRGCHLAAR